MMLHCKVVSHWLGTYTKWSLIQVSKHVAMVYMFTNMFPPESLFVWNLFSNGHIVSKSFSWVIPINVWRSDKLLTLDLDLISRYNSEQGWCRISSWYCAGGYKRYFQKVYFSCYTKGLVISVWSVPVKWLITRLCAPQEMSSTPIANALDHTSIRHFRVSLMSNWYQ